MNTNANLATNTATQGSPEVCQAILNIADRMAGAAKSMHSQGYEELITARDELKTVCFEWQQELDIMNCKLVKIKKELLD